MDFQHLLTLRWSEACRAVGLDPQSIRITWDVGDYPHFQQPRGYAVAMNNGNDTYHLLFAEKILRAPNHRADGLVRHEIGHILDFLFEPRELDRWAVERGVKLPSTPERRADSIAEAVWGQKLKYDADTVQSTRYGSSPRPTHLGL
jgi:hypothetical protein